ncbi:hydroxyisourate hydrolase [Pontibacter chinhatensis]|uniref:5-hydroxyisourate hydrolase n=1 Tax=Pontibacter chinhatensis TaxID=1436961 RepID=A0A1I2N9F2_9BACT|nr:hydroxyisourate hydrolase [Pontibacter chinhatensis]SFF98337.1 5-hydroxyisourate hydrolase [Pontibacter chinhatensis]
MRHLILTFLLSLAVSVAFSQAHTHQLSSHILDVSTGRPAAGVPVKLEKLNEKNGKWTLVEEKKTDSKGRIKDFLDYKKTETGVYRLTFLVADYFKQQNTETFYPFIEVVFQIKDGEHYHVPITLSPYGYSTYRGN